MKEVKKIVKVQIKRRPGLAFCCSIDEKVPEVINNDKQRIKQILLNLVSNSLKVTLKGQI